jgi:hypothetical protein
LNRIEHMEPLAVPMLNNLPDYHKQWRSEIQTAIIVSERHSCHVHLSRHDHQVVKIIGPGIQLVLYPHRTSARNYHIRVRDEASKDVDATRALVKELQTCQKRTHSTFYIRTTTQ